MPLTAARIGDRVLVSVPGEMTVELARRTRAAARAGDGRLRPPARVVAGYANEYVSYLTTPEEYEAQHYEGGTTVYGPASGAFVASALGDLAGRLARGVAAPAPYPFDPTRGLRPDGPAYPRGASAGRAVRQPRAARRLGRPSFVMAGRRGRPRPPARPRLRVGAAPFGRQVAHRRRRPRPAHPVADRRRPAAGAGHPRVRRGPARDLPGLVGGAPPGAGRHLPLRCHGHPLPACLAFVRTAAGEVAAAGEAAAPVQGCSPLCCATRQPCRSGI